jgi:hypothetical protein
MNEPFTNERWKLTAKWRAFNGERIFTHDYHISGGLTFCIGVAIRRSAELFDADRVFITNWERY